MVAEQRLLRGYIIRVIRDILLEMNSQYQEPDYDAE